MEKWTFTAEVIIPKIGKVKHSHYLTFNDNENVFGRVWGFREHMKKTFPNREYKLLEARRVKQ